MNGFPSNEAITAPAGSRLHALGKFIPGADRPVRDYGSLDPVLGRIGSLEVRLATTAKEIRRAQRLRFKVFYEEMSASPHGAALISRRDVDAYDAICDHLLVLDHDVKPKPFRNAKPKVVGTYRLLRQDVANRHGGFYTRGEYDIAPLLRAHPDLRFLELGRSCVLKPYRNKRTVELLWHGIWTYVLHHRIDVMIGCASLEGTQPQQLALPLSFLHHYAAAPAEWQARALPGRFTAMDILPKERGRSQGGAPCPAAADQGLSAPRRHLRHGRRDRPAVRHHGRARGAAGLGDQPALYRPFRAGGEPSRGVRLRRMALHEENATP